MTRLAPVGLLAVALTSGCMEYGPYYCEGDWAATPLEEAPPPMTQARLVGQVQPTESSAVDILFVIDNSRSMTDEQEQLGIWSSELFHVLASTTGELPDLHIAVTSSSIAIPGLAGCETGTGGTFHVGTAALTGTRFLTDVAGVDGRERNYTGTLTDNFAKMARVGDTGCGFEQPFKAAHLALSGYTSGTEGFLRDEALLLVVFVTDEDDCTATDSTLFSDPYADVCSELGPITSYRCFEHGVDCHDGLGSRALGERRYCRPDESGRYMQSVAGFADALKRLKAHPGQVMVAGIYGKPNQITAIPDERLEAYQTPRLANVCNPTTRDKEGDGATPAVRMNALMAAFGGRASHSSICENELAWAMRDAGLIARDVATRSPCLRGALVDSDTATPGVQPSCRVDVVRGFGTSRETRERIPPCGEGTDAARCFTTEIDTYRCATTQTQVAIRVDDGGEGETVNVVCDVDVAADMFAHDPSIADPRAYE